MFLPICEKLNRAYKNIKEPKNNERPKFKTPVYIHSGKKKYEGYKENMREPKNYLENIFINDYTELKCHFINGDRVLAEERPHWLVCLVLKGLKVLTTVM